MEEVAAQVDIVHVVVIWGLAMLDDLTDLKRARESNVEVFESRGLRSVSSERGKVKSIHFIFRLILQSQTGIEPLTRGKKSTRPLRGNVTVVQSAIVGWPIKMAQIW